jgi:uncharacterized membrane protein
MGFGTYSSTGIILVVLTAFLIVLAIKAPSSVPPTISRRDSARLEFICWTIAIAYLALSIYAVRITNADLTDVYLWQREATRAFLHGTDPYTVTHENIFGAQSWYFYPPGAVYEGRVHVGLQYPPLSLLLIVPGYLIGDLRYSGIAALLITAYLLFRRRADRFATLVVAALLLSPLTFYLISRGFSEPLVLLTLTCTIVAARRRSRWLPLFFAAFLSTKQYCVLALPFAGFLIPSGTRKDYVRLLAIAIGISLLLCVPFAIWDFPHFWHDLVVVNFGARLRPESLTFSVLTWKLGWGSIPGFVIALAVIAAIAWCLVRAPRNPAMFAACFGLVLLVMLALHKQGFINYYFLVIGSLLVAAREARIYSTPSVRAPVH